MSLPRVGSAVVVVHGDRVLLGVRAKEPNRGKWVLPGGKIEPFESIEDAARREVMEETGLEVQITEQLGTFEIIDPPNEHRLIVFSLAEPVGGELRSASDLENVCFMSLEEVGEVEVTPVVAMVLSRVLARRNLLAKAAA